MPSFSELEVVDGEPVSTAHPPMPPAISPIPADMTPTPNRTFRLRPLFMWRSFGGESSFECLKRQMPCPDRINVVIDACERHRFEQVQESNRYAFNWLTPFGF
jgi:hypothetical protein